ncbi:hypothetical protein D3C71_2005410 [compost metagenome]
MGQAYRIRATVLPVLQRAIVEATPHPQALARAVKGHQRRQYHVERAQWQHVAHVELGLENVEAVVHQRRFRGVMQE